MVTPSAARSVSEEMRMMVSELRSLDTQLRFYFVRELTVMYVQVHTIDDVSICDVCISNAALVAQIDDSTVDRLFMHCELVWKPSILRLSGAAFVV